MRQRNGWLSAGVILTWVFTGSHALAQQVGVTTPATSVGQSYYEQMGVRWGVRGKGWFFNFGGPPVAPQFGGFDPQAGASFGFAGPRGFLNVTAGQGSDTSFGSSAASVTVPNGGFGMVGDISQRPFVTEITPVVGSVLQERLSRLDAEAPASKPSESTVSPPAAPPLKSSTAARGDLSVVEIKAQKAEAQAAAKAGAEEEVAALLERARGAEAAGKPGVARIYLQMASKRATGEQRTSIEEWLKRLGR